MPLINPDDALNPHAAAMERGINTVLANISDILAKPEAFPGAHDQARLQLDAVVPFLRTLARWLDNGKPAGEVVVAYMSLLSAITANTMQNFGITNERAVQAFAEAATERLLSVIFEVGHGTKVSGATVLVEEVGAGHA